MSDLIRENAVLAAAIVIIRMACPSIGCGKTIRHHEWALRLNAIRSFRDHMTALTRR